MTPYETVVIEKLEHEAQTWDATDPEQAGAFRDAASVLRELADQKIVPVAAAPFPPTQEPTPEPVRVDEPMSPIPDPNDKEPDQGAPTNG